MKKICLLCLSFLLLHNAQSQGCSDAGACSIGRLKSGIADNKSYVALNVQAGSGEQNTNIYVTQAEVFFKVKKRSGLQFKLPYVFVQGNLGSTNGLGDITAAFTHTYYDTGKWRLGINAGFKIGVNNADKKSGTSLGNKALPMPYQTSLGTHDVIIGLDAAYNKKWLFGLAFQMPVYQFNNNSFDTALIPVSQTEAKQYFTSAQLLRRPDILLRIDRSFSFLNDHLMFQVGLLPIYHLGHDRFTDSTGVSHALSGSKGLTLNFNFSLNYKLGNNLYLSARAAAPLITRKVRPDGLTRHSVAAVELRYSF